MQAATSEQLGLFTRPFSIMTVADSDISLVPWRNRPVAIAGTPLLNSPMSIEKEHWPGEALLRTGEINCSSPSGISGSGAMFMNSIRRLA
jgi:hypothetical protein